MTKNSDYHPVATAVPAGDEEDNLLVASAVDTPSIEEAAAATTTTVGLTQQQEQLRATVPEWTDTFFDGREDVWAVFDFNSEALIRNSSRFNLLVLIVYLYFVFDNGDDSIPVWIVVGAILCWNANRASVGTHTTRHLALTREGVLYVHEKHRTWYGMKGHYQQLCTWDEINLIDPKYASGDVVCCFEFAVHTVTLREYHTPCDPQVGFLLEITGIQQAKEFVKIVQQVSNAKRRGDNVRRTSAAASVNGNTPTPFAEAATVELGIPDASPEN